MVLNLYLYRYFFSLFYFIFALFYFLFFVGKGDGSNCDVGSEPTGRISKLEAIALKFIRKWSVNIQNMFDSLFPSSYSSIISKDVRNNDVFHLLLLL